MKFALVLSCILVASSLFRLNIDLSEYQLQEQPVVTKSTSKDHSFAGVNTTSGYIVVDSADGSALFYWLFPSVTQPPKATVIWIQGGPGCSGELGCLVEKQCPFTIHNGQPYRIVNSWADSYNVVYIDQPVGVGFSTQGTGKHRNSTEQAADDFLKAMKELKTIHDTLFELDWYLVGESYAGHYIPAFANRIDGDIKNWPTFKGLAIGDGWVDPYSQMTYYGTQPYSLGIVDAATTAKLEGLISKAQKAINETKWSDVNDLNNQIIGLILDKSYGIDILNYRVYDDPMSTPFVEGVINWLNSAATQEALGVAGNRTWAPCDDATYMQFLDDLFLSHLHYLPSLVEKYRVLIYNGQDDVEVSAAGTQLMVSLINWSKKADFNKSKPKSWKVGGEVVGYAKNVENLTQLIVLKAGHLLPQDQPTLARIMLRTFVEGESFA